MAKVDVSVAERIVAPPDRVRTLMFDARHDPRWMSAVKEVEPLATDLAVGARVRRVGRFMGRTLRWTTEVVSVSADSLDLEIIDGPMRGTVHYRIAAVPGGSLVTIRNVGEAPAFAPRAVLRFAMRRALSADLRRLRDVVEAGS